MEMVSIIFMFSISKKLYLVFHKVKMHQTEFIYKKGMVQMLRTEYSLVKAKISIDKLLNNINEIKKGLMKNTSFMAVIKADAYSHGAIRLAKEMEQVGAVDYFGVAQLQEAIELRDVGVKTPILVLSTVRTNEIDLIIKNGITMTVFSKEIAEKITERATTLNKKVRVHLKIDTGMARLGTSTFEEAFELYQILDTPFVEVEGIFTHLADADEPSPNSFSHHQFTHFQNIIHQFIEREIDFKLKHVCNTAGTLNFPDYHLDMVRVGIGLYGFNPTTVSEKMVEKQSIPLSPIQNLNTMVTHVKDLPAGKSVGYNRTYYSTETTRVATIAIGYADGVPKILSNQAVFTYQGKKLPIIGQICMDQIMLDCSAVPDLAVGDYVNYFGDPNEGYSSVVDLAKKVGSSEYELLCHIGNRVERLYK